MNIEKNCDNTKVFLPVIEAIKELLQREDRVIVGIDGRCGSGKSTLAALLESKLSCNVFHMDDFFLPQELRDEARINEPGGNVHYERFAEEVMKPLSEKREVAYRPFDCKNGSLVEPSIIHYKKLTIIEGSYSLHPAFDRYYNYKIFLTVNEIEQLARIERRSGKDKLQMFINKWIPLEERYFAHLKIDDKCDLIIDTTFS